MNDSLANATIQRNEERVSKSPDVIQRLRRAGFTPGAPQDDNELRNLALTATNQQAAMLAQAKQQIIIANRQLEANERTQEIAVAQWVSIYASDILKWCVEKGVPRGDKLHSAARARVLKVLSDTPEDDTMPVPTDENIDDIIPFGAPPPQDGGFGEPPAGYAGTD